MSLNPRAIRKALKLNQSEFWSPIGVTQSGGSRYESGREMPPPAQLLFNLVYVQDVEDGIRQLQHWKTVTRQS